MSLRENGAPKGLDCVVPGQLSHGGTEGLGRRLVEYVFHRPGGVIEDDGYFADAFAESHPVENVALALGEKLEALPPWSESGPSDCETRWA